MQQWLSTICKSFNELGIIKFNLTIIFRTNLLNRFSDITPEGKFVTSIKGSGRARFLAMADQVICQLVKTFFYDAIILDFSKLKHNNLELHLRSVGLREITEVVLTLSQSLVGDKKLKLFNKIPADLPPANADENRLQQISYILKVI